jgi:hypothetical protein
VPTNGGISELLGIEEKLPMSQVEVIDSTELAKRLNVPETWVRSRTNPKRTSDPIPHFRLGRYIRFPWGSEELREWLERQLVSTNRAGH